MGRHTWGNGGRCIKGAMGQARVNADGLLRGMVASYYPQLPVPVTLPSCLSCHHCCRILHQDQIQSMLGLCLTSAPAMFLHLVAVVPHAFLKQVANMQEHEDGAKRSRAHADSVVNSVYAPQSLADSTFSPHTPVANTETPLQLSGASSGFLSEDGEAQGQGSLGGVAGGRLYKSPAVTWLLSPRDVPFSQELGGEGEGDGPSSASLSSGGAWAVQTHGLRAATPARTTAW